MATACLAFLGIESAQGYILFGLRLLLALAGAVAGWYLAQPVARVLFRLAFHRPIPPKALGAARVVGAVALGALVFYLFPLGLGDGPGPGGGPGLGPGAGGKGGKPAADAAGKDGKGADKKGEDAPPPGVLRVEMIPSQSYRGDEKFYYLPDRKDPVTLAEVDKHLVKHKDKLRVVEILIYANSVEAGHRSVHDLRALANSLGLTVGEPPEYRTKTKVTASP